MILFRKKFLVIEGIKKSVLMADALGVYVMLLCVPC